MFKVGDCAIIFNSKEWMKTGDVGNNSRFWQRAIILNIRKDKSGELLADVRFENGVESKGHFLDGIKEC